MSHNEPKRGRQAGKQSNSYRPTSLKKFLKKVQANLLKRKAIPKRFKSELKALSCSGRDLVPMLWFYIMCSHFSHHVCVLHKSSSLPSLLCKRPSSNKRGNQHPGETCGVWAKARKIFCSFQLAVSFLAMSRKTCLGFYFVL